MDVITNRVIVGRSLSRAMLWIVLAGLAVLSACASGPQSKSTGEYVDDSVITSRVKAAIADDDMLEAFKIDVDTYKGVVQLSGFVDNPTTAQRAQEAARTVPGVRQVINNLVPKSDVAGGAPPPRY